MRSISSIIDTFLNPLQIGKRKQRKRIPLVISKRQKFVGGVVILALGLFLGDYLFGKYAAVLAFVLAFITDGVLYVGIYQDLKEQKGIQPFLLPFLCSLSFGLFYFLTPARLLSRIILSILYAISLYSLFLSENIFVVASIRTIALLNSARIVTFIITLISYFFLSNIIFSLRLSIIPTVVIFALFSLLFVAHALWTYTLNWSFKKDIHWTLGITLILLEIAAVLWFWPTSPTVVALFLTATLYIATGLAHTWFDKRLFRGVLWEYMWVAVFAFLILLWFTHWQG